jgi:hypothetical protein
MQALARTLKKGAEQARPKVSAQAPAKTNAVRAGDLASTNLLKKLKGTRHAEQLSLIRADRQRWFVIAVILGLVNLAIAYGWHIANDRFANNVRVAWVKLDPSGGYTVQFAEENQPTEFFQITVDRMLKDFVIKRFSRSKLLITANYSHSYVLMGQLLREQFVNEFRAAEIASQHINCVDCPETEVRIRVLQHMDNDRLPIKVWNHSRDQFIYTSMVYITELDRNQGTGTIMAARNRIIKLNWTFKSKEDILKSRNELEYNPLGLRIEQMQIQNDPTPVLLEQLDKGDQ